MKSDLKLLDEKALNYFDSINDLFHYRLKNYWKYNTSTSILLILVLFAIFNFIPLFPSLNDIFFKWFLNFINAKLFVIEKINFWVKWLTGVVFSGILVALFYPFQKYWSNQITRKAVSSSSLNFCYLFIARKELRNYLINERDEHLKKTSKYLREVLDHFNMVKIDDKEILKVSTLISKIKKNIWWFSIDEKTQKYVEAIESIPNKIYERLNQKVLINDLLETIDWLTIYEYSKIRPNEQIDGEKRVGDNTSLYFNEFIISTINLSIIDLPITETIKSSKGVKDLMNYFNVLLSNDSLFLMFFSWLVLLSILFFVVAIVVVQALNISIDSTFLIGMLSAPFIGAITFSATIFSKKRK